MKNSNYDWDDFEKKGKKGKNVDRVVAGKMQGKSYKRLGNEVEDIVFRNVFVFEIILDPGRAVFQKGNEYSLGKAIGHNPSMSIFEIVVDFLSGIAALTARASSEKIFVFLAIARDGRMYPGIVLWFYGEVWPPLGFWLAERSIWAVIKMNFANTPLATTVGGSFGWTGINMVSTAMSIHIAHGFASRTKGNALFVEQDFLLIERRKGIGCLVFSSKNIARGWLMGVWNSIQDFAF